MDETKMGLVGVGMVLKKVKYAVIAVVVFLFFAYVLTLFKDGTATWGLLWSNIDLGEKIALKWEVWGRVVGNFVNLWGLLLMFLAMLQGVAVAILVFSWRSRTMAKGRVAGLEAGGVGTAMGALALGCPTCGTTLVAPFLSIIFGTGAGVMAEVLGWVLMVVAVVFLLYAVRKLGYGVYIEITARRYKNAKA